MILSLSWKNIWRTRHRSLVVIGAIIIGVWSLIFMMGFYNSFINAFARNSINNEYSHIQIHNPEYLIEPDLATEIQNETAIRNMLVRSVSVEAVSSRRKVNAMIASTKTSLGVQVFGIDPDDESKTTNLESHLVEGSYFLNIKRNPILVSVKTAEKLKLKLKSKVVITFQDYDGNITAASCRVSGIFDSKAPRINERVVYMKKVDINRLVGNDGVNEVAILLNDVESIPEVINQLEPHAKDTVRSYKEVAPELNLMENSSRITKIIVTAIIMLALVFGIINTMLMAVLERTKEIGMLRSVGMHRKSIFTMIMLETILMGFIGGPMGLGFGYLTILILGKVGLDLSSFSEALDDFGIDTILYPSVETSTYPVLMFVVLFTALLGAIYPAIKAIRLNPLDAIRKI